MRYILSILVVSVSLTIVAQDAEDDSDYLYIENQDYRFIDSTVLKKEDKKISVGVDVGMAYTFSKGFSGPMFTLAPHANYKLTDRLSVNAGLMAGYGSFYSPYYSLPAEDANMLPMMRMYFYGSVNYKLTDKLTTHTSVYTSMLDVPNPNAQRSPSSFQSYGTSVGFTYQIAPGVSFGAQVRVQQGNYYDPFMPVNSPGNYAPNWW